MLRRIAILVALFCVALGLYAGGKKKPQQAYQVLPDQTADLLASSLVTARQNCENWAVAAGLESMLRAQNVTLSQNFWVMRLNGGELCVDTLPSMDKVADAVNKA